MAPHNNNPFQTPTKARKRRTPPRDKVETSPNNRSKCYKCGKKIIKGEQRIGIVEHNEYGTNQRYYHQSCLPNHLKDRIPSVEKMKTIKVIEKRKELEQNLRSLRSCFANILNVEHYRIFQNKSLDELVLKMPTTKQELLSIWGIKEKKVESFGDAIITIIQQYKMNHQTSASTTMVEKKPKMKQSKQNRKKKSQSSATSDDEDDDHDKVSDDEDDDIVVVEKTLTCEEIVKRKFEHAKANGYVISVD